MAENGNVLVTPRLVLRPFEEKDAEALLEIYSDGEVTKYLRREPYDTLTDAETFIRGILAAENPQLFCRAIELQETGKVVGSVRTAVDQNDNCGELTFAVSREFWGKGIASEAVREAVVYLMTECGINRISGVHAVTNPAAGGVLRKVGMSYEGVARQLFRNSQGYHDCHRYAILKSDI